MAQFFYGMSMYGVCAAIASADNGCDGFIAEPGYWPCYEWGSGLGRIDREATFTSQPNTHLRTGVLRRLLLRFGDLAGLNNNPSVARKEHLFPTMEAVQQVVFEELAKYATRKVVDGVQHGQITWRLNAPLEKVTKNREGDAVLSVTCGGQIYPILNYVDCTPELDLIRMADLPLDLGRESRALTGEATAGNRLDTPSTVLAYNPVTGQRLPQLECAPREVYHDGDARTMAFNQRIIVTQSPGLIKWADLELPWYNPADYDIDFALAVAKNQTTIPGSVAADAMLPIGQYEEHDMNNGGGLVFGSNWPGRLFEWHYATHERRRYLHALYTQQKAGLFKDICFNPRWRNALPRMVADTESWGLVPGLFTYPEWQANTAYAVGTRKYKKPYIYEVTTAGTTGTVGPTGAGEGIADGSVVWKMYLPFVPGMSPHMYVRESFRIEGQITLDYDHTQPPEHEVFQAICAYAYPHMDGHIVQRFANENGFVTHEGNDNLEGDGDVMAQLMPWGACKPPSTMCRNVSAVCGVSATRLGWIPSRIEFSYIKIANALGIIGAVADRLGVYANDVDYESQAKPALIAGEMYVALPRAS